MPEEWIIELTADHAMAMIEIGSTSVTFDRAFELFVDSPPQIIEIGTDVSYDRAVFPWADAEGASLLAYPSKDWSIGGEAEILGYCGLVADAKKTVAATLESEIASDMVVADVDPKIDHSYALQGDLGEYIYLFASPTEDRADSLDSVVIGDLKVELSHLERSILTIPPDGLITILNSSSGTQGESGFDQSKIERGVTTILEAEVVGTRLDTYLIEFFVKYSENDLPFIHKSSAKNKGGITIVSITPAPDAPGSRQLAILQIILKPEDTAMIEKTRVCLYELRMSNRGMSEDYRVAPRKDKNQTGTFTIIV